MNTPNKRLYRSETNKVVFGIMGGLGEYFDIDPVIFRAGYTVFSFFTGIAPGIFAYIIMGLVIPRKPLVMHEKAEEVKHHAEH